LKQLFLIIILNGLFSLSISAEGNLTCLQLHILRLLNTPESIDDSPESFSAFCQGVGELRGNAATRSLRAKALYLLFDRYPYSRIKPYMDTLAVSPAEKDEIIIQGLRHSSNNIISALPELISDLGRLFVIAGSIRESNKLSDIIFETPFNETQTNSLILRFIDLVRSGDSFYHLTDFIERFPFARRIPNDDLRFALALSFRSDTENFSKYVHHFGLSSRHMETLEKRVR